MAARLTWSTDSKQKRQEGEPRLDPGAALCDFSTVDQTKSVSIAGGWIPPPQLFGDVISGWKSWLLLSRGEGRRKESGKGGRKTQWSFRSMEQRI